MYLALMASEFITLIFSISRSMRREAAPDFYLGHVLPTYDPLRDPAWNCEKVKNVLYFYRYIYKGYNH